MPRSGRLRSYIREIAESPRFEQLSFIPPFLVLIVELILLEHAIRINIPYVIELTLVLLILSVIEIIFVAEEIHEHYLTGIFERVLTIRLDDFIIERKRRSVRYIVEDFIDTYPNYSAHRDKIYRITCQIMETHREEAIEKDLLKKLNSFVRKRKKDNVDDIIKLFIQKYPKYRKYRNKIYERTCQIKDNLSHNRKI